MSVEISIVADPWSTRFQASVLAQSSVRQRKSDRKSEIKLLQSRLISTSPRHYNSLHGNAERRSTDHSRR
jgi:hypothetical protein